MKMVEDKNKLSTNFNKLMDMIDEGNLYAKMDGSKYIEKRHIDRAILAKKNRIDKIEKKGVIICYITLHVGLGTFRPVNVEDVTKHKMHSEFYSMSKNSAKILSDAKKDKRNIISVGTTTTRTLETIMSKYGEFRECSGLTDIFIYPGYEFKGIDGLITNFHLPKSTLVMLVSAFASKEIILNAYKHAVEDKYRFFSFGDAMFIHK